MTIEASCPSCNKRLKGPEGAKVRCPGCKTVFQLPSPIVEEVEKEPLEEMEENEPHAKRNPEPFLEIESGEEESKELEPDDFSQKLSAKPAPFGDEFETEEVEKEEVVEGFIKPSQVPSKKERFSDSDRDRTEAGIGIVTGTRETSAGIARVGTVTRNRSFARIAAPRTGPGALAASNVATT